MEGTIKNWSLTKIQRIKWIYIYQYGKMSKRELDKDSTFQESTHLLNPF